VLLLALLWALSVAAQPEAPTADPTAPTAMDEPSALDAATMGAELGGEASPEQKLRTLEQQLEALDQAGKARQLAIDEGRQALVDQTERLEAELRRMDALALRVDSLAEKAERLGDTLARHETRLEENSVKLFETLAGIDEIKESLATLGRRVERMPDMLLRRAGADEAEESEAAAPGQARLLLALVLAVIFPIGVLLFLDGRGIVATVGNGSTGLRVPALDGGSGRLLAWLGGALGYILFFAVIRSLGAADGVAGGAPFGAPVADLAKLLDAEMAGELPQSLLALLVQLPLAAAFGLVVCSATPLRLTPLGGLMVGTLATALLYPVFGQWATAADAGVGGGWLAGLGFVDPAVATGFGVLAGGAALAAALLLKRPEEARLGLPQPWPAAGVLLLWSAWLLAMPVLYGDLEGAPWLGFSTLVAGLGAALGLMLAGSLLQSDGTWSRRLPGGILAGVIAAAAAHGQAAGLSMLLFGAAVGGLYCILARLVLRRLGSATELALVLVAGGLGGTLAPGLFGAEGLLAVGVANDLLPQLAGLGTAVVMAAAVGSGLALVSRVVPGMTLPAAKASGDR
jgi:hypothetical protein